MLSLSASHQEGLLHGSTHSWPLPPPTPPPPPQGFGPQFPAIEAPLNCTQITVHIHPGISSPKPRSSATCNWRVRFSQAGVRRRGKLDLSASCLLDGLPAKSLCI